MTDLRHGPQYGESSPGAPLVGRVIAYKYRVLRRLGEGGMGTVYEAENVLTLKRAALKWLRPGTPLTGEMARQRLLREARAMARVRHRNVVEIYDVLIDGEMVFLVMELLEGATLTVHLAAPRTLHEVIGLLLPVMRGAAAAHSVGVVHRDVKPENVFLAHDSKTGETLPMLIDFGISHMLEEGVAPLTRSGVTMGTPRYISYEQLSGGEVVDARADVYSFGVILYECAAGFPPYDANTLTEQAIQFVTTEPVPLQAARPELPEALCAAIMAAVAKQRDQRTRSMAELIQALAPFAEPGGYPQPLSARAPRPISGPTGVASYGANTSPATAAADLEFPAASSRALSNPGPPPAIGLRGWARIGAVAGVALIGAAAATSRMSTDASRSGAPTRPRLQGSQRVGSPTAVESGRGPSPSAIEPSLVPVPYASDAAAVMPAAAPEEQVVTVRSGVRSRSHTRTNADQSVDAGPATEAGIAPAQRPDQPSSVDVEHRADPLFKHQF